MTARTIQIRDQKTQQENQSIKPSTDTRSQISNLVTLRPNHDLTALEIANKTSKNLFKEHEIFTVNNDTTARRHVCDKQWQIIDPETLQGLRRFSGSFLSGAMFSVRFNHTPERVVGMERYDATGEVFGGLLYCGCVANANLGYFRRVLTVCYTPTPSHKRFYNRNNPQETFDKADVLILRPNGNMVACWI